MKMLFAAALAMLVVGCANLSLSTEAAYTFLKCGGIGGEQQFSRCSWRKTSVFASHRKSPQLMCKKVARRSVTVARDGSTFFHAHAADGTWTFVDDREQRTACGAEWFTEAPSSPGADGLHKEKV